MQSFENFRYKSYWQTIRRLRDKNGMLLVPYLASNENDILGKWRENFNESLFTQETSLQPHVSQMPEH